MNKITRADISDPQEVIARAKALSLEPGIPIRPGFEMYRTWFGWFDVGAKGGARCRKLEAELSLKRWFRMFHSTASNHWAFCPRFDDTQRSTGYRLLTSG
jgi:hypothetical protein